MLDCIIGIISPVMLFSPSLPLPLSPRPPLPPLSLPLLLSPLSLSLLPLLSLMQMFSGVTETEIQYTLSILGIHQDVTRRIYLTIIRTGCVIIILSIGMAEWNACKYWQESAIAGICSTSSNCIAAVDWVINCYFLHRKIFVDEYFTNCFWLIVLVGMACEDNNQFKESTSLKYYQNFTVYCIEESESSPPCGCDHEYYSWCLATGFRILGSELKNSFL